MVPAFLPSEFKSIAPLVSFWAFISPAGPHHSVLSAMLIRRAIDYHEEWSLLLDDSFVKVEGEICDTWQNAPGQERRGRGPCAWRLFQHADDCVSASFSRSGNHMGEPYEIESLDECVFDSLGGLEVEPHEVRKSAGFESRAYLIPAHPERAHWCLYTFSSTERTLAQIHFSFPTRDDSEWAMNAWRSIDYVASRITEYVAEHPLVHTYWDHLRMGSGCNHETMQYILRENLVSEAVALAVLALQQGNPTIRGAACMGLEYLGDPSCIPSLRAMLADSDWMVRMRAAEALVHFDEPASGVIEILIAGLKQPEPSATERAAAGFQCPIYHAARILGRLGAQAEPAREALRQTLQSQFGIARSAAACTLAMLGEPPESYLPSLYEALHDTASQPPHERAMVADALFRLGEPASRYLPSLIELANQPDWHACGYALGILGAMGSDAAPAIPALRTLTRSTLEGVAHHAAVALRSIEESMK